MKNILKKVALPVVIVTMILGLSQTAAASGTFRVTAGVHVRSSASTTASSMTTVNAGDSVDVLEHDPAGWSKVQVGSTVGYIRSDFLKFSIGDTPATFYTTAGVHVRASASTSAKSLATVTAGDAVEVLEHNPAGWSKVRVGGITGYIRSDFLKHEGTASSSSSGAGGILPVSGEGDIIGQLKTLGNVNMRTEPTTSSKVIKLLSDGTVVGLLKNESNGWSRVTYNGATGYIRSDLLAQESATAGQNAITLYTVGNVNFRSSASTSSSIIRTLAKGTAVDVMAIESDGWSKVVHNGKDGYIKSDLLTPSSKGETETRYVTGNVNLRKGPTTSSSIIRTLVPGSAVTVISTEMSGKEEWSRVTHNGTEGYIRSDLLSNVPLGPEPIIARLQVVAPSGANVRSGPNASTKKLGTLNFGSEVEVYANEAGWTRVKYQGGVGYIRSDLLGSAAKVELVTMAEISSTLPYRQNIRVVDVRTGVSFNIQIFSKGTHADYDFPTRADVDAMFSTRNGVRSWAARPVWVYVGNRVYAAATHGMPHDVSFVSGNGIDGHFCLHFRNTTANSKSYQEDLRRAVQEAYDKRP